jgi:addiction module HigA family antidote
MVCNKHHKVNKFVYFYIVKDELSILKGIHPGFVLDRKLKELNVKKGQLALDCREYPQTITAITKGKRDMNIGLSLKLEKALGLEEGFFMTLQIFYDIKQEKQKENNRPNLKKLRRILFWDTKMENIHWQQHDAYVIRRVFEKGNDDEKKEIERFYGTRVDDVLKAHK